MAIYLKPDKEIKLPVDVILELYSENQSNTSKPTYSNKEYTLVECNKNKNRSIEALMELILTYFPNFQSEDFLDLLLDAFKYKKDIQGFLGDDKVMPYPIYCNDIEACTLWFEPLREHYIDDWKDLSLEEAECIGDWDIIPDYTWHDLITQWEQKNGKKYYKQFM